MVEILGSKYCHACLELKRRLDKQNIEYIFYEMFAPILSVRYVELADIALDEGYDAHPIAFYNGVCLGEGLSVLHHINKELSLNEQ